MGERGCRQRHKDPSTLCSAHLPHQPPLSDQHSLYPNICTYHSLPPPGGTKVFNKENQRGAIPSTLTKTWRFFIRLIYDMTVIGSILMVWCDQLILLFVRTRLDWLFWQNDAGGWYHNRVGINLRYYLSNRLIRNWWQNTIQKWIWKGVSLTYFHSIYWTSAENVYFILDISITSPRTENPLAAEISLRVGDRFNQDVSHHLEGLSSFQFQNSKFQSNIKNEYEGCPSQATLSQSYFCCLFKNVKCGQKFKSWNPENL